jgi:hypothetical protein
MRGRLFFLFFLYAAFFFFFFAPFFSLNAQEKTDPPPPEISLEKENSENEENSEQNEEQNEEKKEKESIEEMDIRTSTFSELADWCGALGLSEGGTKQELANRLRDYYKLPRPDGKASSSEKNRTITIESARNTEYFTIEVVNEDYARLKGGVVITLKDGDAVHRISAEEILYNRTRNLMSASGGISYEKKEGDSTETFQGDSITVNLDNWASIFTNGQSERAVASAGTAYRFEGTVISRDGEESTVLTDAVITNAKTEEPYWSLRASKMWLMPGSDWAVANAVLKVGEIPVLWLPFFYLPTEEIVFHPVVGMRTREGNFFQTTTYLLGRPKAEKVGESSFTSMFGSDENSEKVRKGLFLRSTGKRTAPKNEPRLSVLFDVYANLGAYLGTEFFFPRKTFTLGKKNNSQPKSDALNPPNSSKNGFDMTLGDIALSAGFGFTRNIYEGNTPYLNGEEEWNSANRFFSFDVPFRYRFKTTGSLSAVFGVLNWTMPLYSDPYVEQDFTDRSENLDWGKLLKGNAAFEETDTTDKTLGAYSWNLGYSFTPNISSQSVVSPYITSVSISNLSSNLAFNRKNSTKLSGSASPNRLFFYPDKWTLFSLSAAISGTPLKVGGAVSSDQSSSEKASGENEKNADILQGIGTPIPPWEEKEEREKNEKKKNAGASVDSGEKWDNLIPPVLTQNFTLPASSNAQFSIDYRLSPTAASELQFAQSNLAEIEDIDWEKRASVLLSARGDGSIGFSFNQNLGLYAVSLRFSGAGAWQDYPYLNEESAEYDTEQKRDAARLRAYQQTQFSTSFEYSSTLKPFYLNSVWKNTSFQYLLRGLMVKNELNKTSTASDPSWDIAYGEWKKEKIDSHQFIANVNADIMEKIQNLTLTADMPPRDVSLSGSASIRAWISETNIRGKVYNGFTFPQLGLEDIRKEDALLDKRKRTFDPIYITETLKYTAPAGGFWGGEFGTTYSAQQYGVYDPELAEWTNLRSTLTFGGFTTEYTMLRSKKYELIDSTGWAQSQDKETLNPYTFKMGYTKNFKRENLWENRLSFSISAASNLSLDLQRYTYSAFDFRLGFTLHIAEFLDFTFSVLSDNKVIYRYIQDLPPFETGVELPGEKNIFIDLLNSFRFDDEAKRRTSGFKMRSFSLNLEHHLGDWNANLGVTLTPELNAKSTPYKYQFNPKITFLVKWVPIGEIKTEIYVERDKTTDKDKINFK